MKNEMLKNEWKEQGFIDEAVAEGMDLKAEIRKLEQQKMADGYTLVPLEVYFKNGKVKVEIGLAKGKKLYDKRADMAKKDQQREALKEFKMKFK